MSVFDGLKGKAEELKDKAADLVGDNAGKLKDGVGHIGGFIDEKTGHKFSGQVHDLQAKAADLIGKAGHDKTDGHTADDERGPQAPGGDTPSA